MHPKPISLPRRRTLRALAGWGAWMAMGNQSFADAADFTVAKRPIPRTGELLPAVGLGTYQSFDAGNSASERESLKEVLRRAGDYAIARPAREILFTVLNREEKYKSKNFIDTVVFRAGDAVSGWLFEGLRILGLGFAGIAFVGVPIALLWAGTGWMLGRAQEDMRKKQDWRRRNDAPETYQPAAPQDSASTGGMGRVDGNRQPVIR